jgi:hypothetical protein
MASQGAGNLLNLYTCSNTTGGFTVGTTPVLTLNQIEGVTFTPTDAGGVDISVAHIQDSSALDTFLETYAPVPESGIGETVTFEDNTTYGGAQASSPDLVCIHYGAVDTEPSSPSFGKRKVVATVMKVSSTSGAYTTAAATFNRPTLEMVGQKVLATATLSSILNTSKVATSQTLVIAANKYIKRAWLNNAT